MKRKALGDILWLAWILAVLLGLLYCVYGQAEEYCSNVKIINISNETWNQNDSEQLNVAKRRCEEMDKEQPCLKIFKKVEPHVYSVICGEKK